jgi:hypothetical protein
LIQADEYFIKNLNKWFAANRENIKEDEIAACDKGEMRRTKHYDLSAMKDDFTFKNPLLCNHRRWKYAI